MSVAVTVTAEQVRWYRLRKSGLVDPFPGPTEVARAHFGVQAQVSSAAGIAVWNRTRSESAERSRYALEQAIAEGRDVVRTWGQRGTLHLYDAEDWPVVCAASGARVTAAVEKRRIDEDKKGGPVGLDVHERTVRITRDALARSPYQVTKSDVEREGGELAGKAHYAAFLAVAMCGEGCRVDTRDSGPAVLQSRASLRPGATWSQPTLEEATRIAARRFFSTYGPATEKDFRYWMGAKAPETKPAVRILEELGELRSVEVLDGQASTRAWIHRDDEELLGDAAPPSAAWPVHLLGRFDPLLLAHADKGCWIDPEHYRRVWHHTHVEAVLLVGGRISGTWRYTRAAGGLTVHLRRFDRAPLSKATQVEASARAEGIAEYLGSRLNTLEQSVAD